MSRNGSKKKSAHREHSSGVVDGIDRAHSRAMLYATGFKKEDFAKNQVGVVSNWGMVTPCNIHLDVLAKEAAKGVNAAGGKAVEFNTITISDGISMGTEGMKYSLVSREVIADSIETVTGCEGFDGLVALGSCDKNMPGCLIAMARLNRPSVFVYGGTIQPGCLDGEDLDIVSVLEAEAQFSSGAITRKRLQDIEENAIPGAGACGGMYTANTMASAIEALGMSLPGDSAQTAISDAKRMSSLDAGAAVLHLIKRGIRPRDIMTKGAFENAITIVMALGGSTNAVLHLLAMADAVGVRLKIDDFTRVGRRVPVLADLKPSGKFEMAHLVRIGGTLPLMRRLLDAGLLRGECMTVTGRTLGENLAKVRPEYPPAQKIIRPFDDPIKKEGHLVILYGNLAPTGAVGKITGKEGEAFTGKARCFESEEAAIAAINGGKIRKGDVIVIRMEGPKGGPGMREMLQPTSAVMGRGLSKDVALITDGRFSGGTHGFVVGHITPEAFEGGPIALIRNGERITIDARKRRIELHVSDGELSRRRKAWKQPKPRYRRGVLAKYAALVGSASEGAVTDRGL